MSQRFRLSLGMAILFATVCGTAIARPPHGQGSLPANLPSVDQVFQRFDANQDGQLEQNEMPAAVRERFFRADGNRDGFVTKAELQDARRRFAQKEQGPRTVRAAWAAGTARTCERATRAPDKGRARHSVSQRRDP